MLQQVVAVKYVCMLQQMVAVKYVCMLQQMVVVEVCMHVTTGGSGMLHYVAMLHHVYTWNRRTFVLYMVGVVNHSMCVKLLVELLGRNKQVIFPQKNCWMEQTTYRLLIFNMYLKILEIGSPTTERNAQNVTKFVKNASTLTSIIDGAQ